MAKEGGLDFALNPDNLKNKAQDSAIENLEKEVKILREKAVTDDLTGLFSRAYLEEYFNTIKKGLNFSDKERRDSSLRAIAVIYLDIVKFKQFNDQYGHEIGDNVLKKVAERLREVTRSEDALFRVGGDEFVAILAMKDIAPFTLKNKKEEIQSNLKINIEGKIDPIPFDVSVGFEVLHQGDDLTAQELLRIADQKMYADKNRDQYINTYDI